MEDNKIHECFECGAEFSITTAFEEEDFEVVSFCPFCGSEMELEEDDEDDIPEEDEQVDTQSS